ncbi:MAG TPA: 50S ribosomal protein L10 [Candidatus Polarisedimenticolaceae bacterium]|nr:50S ribosomal protein L10 [Candidatus Polarisedimenticolaceae bacterium]
MNRADKAALIETLNGEFSAAPHVIVASFRGLTVNQANELRRRVSRAGGRYRVIKNRLARRAASGTPVEKLSRTFVGPCAVATHDSDPVALAKTLTEFVKDNPQVELVSGLVDAKETIDASGVKQLATLPGLSELRAQLLALVQTPATTLVRLLNTPGAQIARVVDARREGRTGGGTE